MIPYLLWHEWLGGLVEADVCCGIIEEVKEIDDFTISQIVRMKELDK